MNVTTLLATASPAERAQLLAALQDDAQVTPPVSTPGAGAPEATTPEGGSEPPRKRTPLDLTQATALEFRAFLDDGPGVREENQGFVGASCWFRGVVGARGPQGGEYVYGVFVVGPKGQHQRGMLKIAAKHAPALQAGEPVGAWVTFAGATEARLLGYLTQVEVIDAAAATAATRARQLDAKARQTRRSRTPAR